MHISVEALHDAVQYGRFLNRPADADNSAGERHGPASDAVHRDQ